MTAHADRIDMDQTEGVEQALSGHAKRRDPGSRGRRRRRTSSKKRLTPGRVAKYLVFGILGLIALVLSSAEFLRSAKQEDRTNAEQERACEKAYKDGDIRLAAVICKRDDEQKAP